MKRNGTTCVEFAFAAPVLLLVVFATLEFWQVHTQINLATEAAYEGARVGILSGATQQTVEARAIKATQAVGIKGATADCTPISFTSKSVTVTVRVPMEDNSWLVAKYFLPSHIEKKCTLIRELANFEE